MILLLFRRSCPVPHSRATRAPASSQQIRARPENNISTVEAQPLLPGGPRPSAAAKTPRLLSAVSKPTPRPSRPPRSGLFLSPFQSDLSSSRLSDGRLGCSCKKCHADRVDDQEDQDPSEGGCWKDILAEYECDICFDVLVGVHVLGACVCSWRLQAGARRRYARNVWGRFVWRCCLVADVVPT